MKVFSALKNIRGSGDSEGDRTEKEEVDSYEDLGVSSGGESEEEEDILGLEDEGVDGQAGHVDEEELDKLSGQRILTGLRIDPEPVPDEVADHRGRERAAVGQHLGKPGQLDQ